MKRTHPGVKRTRRLWLLPHLHCPPLQAPLVLNNNNNNNYLYSAFPAYSTKCFTAVKNKYHKNRHKAIRDNISHKGIVHPFFLFYIIALTPKVVHRTVLMVLLPHGSSWMGLMLTISMLLYGRLSPRLVLFKIAIYIHSN